LLPPPHQPSSAPTAHPAAAAAPREEIERPGKDHVRRRDDTDADREADAPNDEDESLDDESFDEDESLDDKSLDARYAAHSVPPPLLSTSVARRGAIAGGALLVGVALWFAIGKRRAPTAIAPSPTLADSSASAAAPATSASDDLEMGAIDDTPDEPPPDKAAALALRREARAMLEAGRIDEGVATARRAVEADPGDPETYILLAAGLQDQGKWQEARQIFSKCVRQSSRAARSECVYFATRGK
jgi:tetratricopeptide (TPR) repeat protein